MATGRDELAYRFRLATEEDSAQLTRTFRFTMAHPDGKGRRQSYKAPAARGELLLFERLEPHTKEWDIQAFLEWHMRVDETLTLKDAGATGDPPHPGMVKQLINEVLRSLNPVAVTAKVRADVPAWNEILPSLTGFTLDGAEYRRPYWMNVWRWTRQAARGTPRARGQGFRQVPARGREGPVAGRR